MIKNLILTLTVLSFVGCSSTPNYKPFDSSQSVEVEKRQFLGGVEPKQ